MGTPNNVDGMLAEAKKTLANANKFTQSVEGNPTSAFAPKKPDVPKVPKTHEYSHAPYSLVNEAEDAGKGAAARAAAGAAVHKDLGL